MKSEEHDGEEKPPHGGSAPGGGELSACAGLPRIHRGTRAKLGWPKRYPLTRPVQRHELELRQVEAGDGRAEEEEGAEVHGEEAHRAGAALSSGQEAGHQLRGRGEGEEGSRRDARNNQTRLHWNLEPRINCVRWGMGRLEVKGWWRSTRVS